MAAIAMAGILLQGGSGGHGAVRKPTRAAGKAFLRRLIRNESFAGSSMAPDIFDEAPS
jgi:hypothetical protein